MTLTWQAVAIVSAAGFSFAASAQRPAAPVAGTVPSAAIRGTVKLDGTDGQPVRRASIHLQNIESTGIADASERIAVTNDAGAFAFSALPAGRYVVWATKNAYVPAWYGSRHPGESIGATSLVLKAGQSIADVNMTMAKGAVITGTVRDELGEPAAGARVSVLQSRPDFQSGLRTFVPAGSGNTFRAIEPPVTDNRGVFRIYGLAAGTYVVMADVNPNMAVARRQNSEAEWRWLEAPAGSSPPTGAPAAVASPEPSRPRTFAPVYFPGTPVQAQATPITVAPGEERSGVDLRLQLVATSDLEASVQIPDGVKPTDVQVMFVQNAEDGSRIAGQRRPDAQGRFSFTNLAPGSYSLIARPAPGVAGSFFGRTDLVLAGTDQTVAIGIAQGPRMSGQVVFDGARPAPANLAGIQVTLTPAQAGAVAALGTQTAMTDAKGAFAFNVVLPGSYRVRASTTAASQGGAWALRSATVNSRDVIDAPIEISPGDTLDATLTFTDRLAEVSGSLTDASGRAAPDFVVIVFTADAQMWGPGSRRIAAMRPGLDGHFRFANLPAGKYLMAAVTDVDQFQWFDAAFLGEIRTAALSITLTDGAATVQNLRVASR